MSFDAASEVVCISYRKSTSFLFAILRFFYFEAIFTSDNGLEMNVAKTDIFLKRFLQYMKCEVI